MLHFTAHMRGRFQVAETDADKADYLQVAIVCGFAPMPVFFELRQMFHNFVDFLGAHDKLDINLHVLAPPASLAPDELLRYLQRYADERQLDGVVIANDALSHYLAGDSAYAHLNYILPPDGTPGYKPHGLPKNPFNCKLAYTVPSHQWLRTGGDIKTEGSGINLLGYVLQAVKHVALGYTEVDIHYLHNTKRYPVKPTIVRTLQQFDQLMKLLKRAKYVAIDSEATSLNKLKNTLLTLQFCVAPDARAGQNLWVLPVRHKETPWTARDLRYIQKRLRHWLTRPSKNKLHIYHTGKYDLTQLINQMDVQWFATPIYDVTAGVFSLDENTRFLKAIGISGYSLANVEMRAGFTRPPELVIAKEDRGNMAAFSLEDIAEYGAYDVLTIYHLTFRQIQAAKKRHYRGFTRMVAQQIGAMIVVFSFMEARGILVDKDYLMQLASPIGPLADRIKQTVSQFYDTKAVQKANRLLLRNRKNVQAGGGLFADKADPFIFSIANDESLQTLFFDVLGLQPLRERKGGGSSIDAKFQKAYVATSKHVKMYNAYNKLMKLKSAFADGILRTLNESVDAKADGRIRNSYWFITVLTGRSSATDPNLQQIPAKGDDAKLIKLQFIAARGKVFIKSDFSAHEIRVTGIVSGDKIIKKTFQLANEAVRALRVAGANALETARAAYKKDGDVHILNVRFFYNKEVTADDPLRQDVKITVFQTIYGSQAKSLGVQIGKSTEVAQGLMDKLFDTWRGAKQFMDETVVRGSKRLRVFSPINRPRHLWAYLHPDKWVHFAMNRRGPNAVMQGLASDIGYQASYCVQEELYNTFLKHGINFDGKLILMVHDSMTNEVDIRFAPIMMYLVEHGMTTLVMERMEKVFGLKIDIPFGFDMGLGLSEGSIKKWAEMRYESAVELLKGMAEKGDALHKKRLPDALHNMKKIWEVRRLELIDDPYTMTLRGDTQWYLDNMRGLKVIDHD